MVFAFTLILGGLVSAEIPTSLVENGDFEALHGYFPAGVMVRRGCMGRDVIPHWKVSEKGAPVEIISSRIWESTLGSDESLYAVHLNTIAGPGGIQTFFPSPWITSGSGIARYQLSVDVAGNPKGESSVQRMEVIVSPSKCCSQKLSLTVDPNANSRHLSWKTEHLVLTVHGREKTVMLQFRSLTPGAYGPLIDNVRLVPLQIEDDRNNGFCDGIKNDEQRKVMPVKSSVDQLVERARMSAETWIRQRFFRRNDW